MYNNAPHKDKSPLELAEWVCGSRSNIVKSLRKAQREAILNTQKQAHLHATEPRKRKTAPEKRISKENGAVSASGKRKIREPHDDDIALQMALERSRWDKLKRRRRTSSSAQW